MQEWMIYGANGYTGRLMAEEAVRRGWRPVLAGRSPDAVMRLATSLGLDSRVFDLSRPDDVAAGLSGMRTVLHCAGPFSATFQPMLDGCMRVGAHYLDITGELSVYEALFAQSEAIAQSGITAVSGTGFDVVPTDCLAAMLARELPDATWLRLALTGLEGISPGTAKTLVEGLPMGGYVRHDGKLVRVPAAYRTALIPFEAHPSLAVTVPLGDLVTAYHATGIPNIEVYVRANVAMLAAMRATGLLAGLLGSPAAQSLLKRAAGMLAHGPSADQRATGRTMVWGEVENAQGRKVAMRLHTPEPYRLTVDAGLASVEALARGGVPLGARSPAMAFGADFVCGLPDVRVERVMG
jgi:short subunit dehydrogenase-like uncharacterized protein